MGSGRLASIAPRQQAPGTNSEFPQLRTKLYGLSSFRQTASGILQPKRHERALIGLLCFTGLRPGKAYALDWSAIDLAGGSLSVLRSYDHCGQTVRRPEDKGRSADGTAVRVARG